MSFKFKSCIHVLLTFKSCIHVLHLSLPITSVFSDRWEGERQLLDAEKENKMDVDAVPMWAIAALHRVGRVDVSISEIRGQGEQALAWWAAWDGDVDGFVGWLAEAGGGGAEVEDQRSRSSPVAAPGTIGDGDDGRGAGDDRRRFVQTNKNQKRGEEQQRRNAGKDDEDHPSSPTPLGGPLGSDEGTAEGSREGGPASSTTSEMDSSMKEKARLTEAEALDAIIGASHQHTSMIQVEVIASAPGMSSSHLVKLRAPFDPRLYQLGLPSHSSGGTLRPSLLYAAAAAAEPSKTAGRPAAAAESPPVATRQHQQSASSVAEFPEPAVAVAAESPPPQQQSEVVVAVGEIPESPASEAEFPEGPEPPRVEEEQPPTSRVPPLLPLQAYYLLLDGAAQTDPYTTCHPQHGNPILFDVGLSAHFREVGRRVCFWEYEKIRENTETAGGNTNRIQHDCVQHFPEPSVYGKDNIWTHPKYNPFPGDKLPADVLDSFGMKAVHEKLTTRSRSEEEGDEHTQTDSQYRSLGAGTRFFLRNLVGLVQSDELRSSWSTDRRLRTIAERKVLDDQASADAFSRFQHRSLDMVLHELVGEPRFLFPRGDLDEVEPTSESRDREEGLAKYVDEIHPDANPSWTVPAVGAADDDGKPFSFQCLFRRRIVDAAAIPVVGDGGVKEGGVHEDSDDGSASSRAGVKMMTSSGGLGVEECRDRTGGENGLEHRMTLLTNFRKLLQELWSFAGETSEMLRGVLMALLATGWSKTSPLPQTSRRGRTVSSGTTDAWSTESEPIGLAVDISVATPQSDNSGSSGSGTMPRINIELVDSAEPEEDLAEGATTSQQSLVPSRFPHDMVVSPLSDLTKDPVADAILDALSIGIARFISIEEFESFALPQLASEVAAERGGWSVCGGWSFFTLLLALGNATPNVDPLARVPASPEPTPEPPALSSPAKKEPDAKSAGPKSARPSPWRRLRPRGHDAKSVVESPVEGGAVESPGDVRNSPCPSPSFDDPSPIAEEKDQQMMEKVEKNRDKIRKQVEALFAQLTSNVDDVKDRTSFISSPGVENPFFGFFSRDTAVGGGASLGEARLWGVGGGAGGKAKTQRRNRGKRHAVPAKTVPHAAQSSPANVVSPSPQMSVAADGPAGAPHEGRSRGSDPEGPRRPHSTTAEGLQRSLAHQSVRVEKLKMVQSALDEQKESMKAILETQAELSQAKESDIPRPVWEKMLLLAEEKMQSHLTILESARRKEEAAAKMLGMLGNQLSTDHDQREGHDRRSQEGHDLHKTPLTNLELALKSLMAQWENDPGEFRVFGRVYASIASAAMEAAIPVGDNTESEGSAEEMPVERRRTASVQRPGEELPTERSGEPGRAPAPPEVNLIKHALRFSVTELRSSTLQVLAEQTQLLLSPARGGADASSPPRGTAPSWQELFHAEAKNDLPRLYTRYVEKKEMMRRETMSATRGPVRAVGEEISAREDVVGAGSDEENANVITRRRSGRDHAASVGNPRIVCDSRVVPGLCVPVWGGNEGDGDSVSSPRESLYADSVHSDGRSEADSVSVTSICTGLRDDLVAQLPFETHHYNPFETHWNSPVSPRSPRSVCSSCARRVLGRERGDSSQMFVFPKRFPKV